MKTKRADFAAAFLRGRMVVAGGLGKKTFGKLETSAAQTPLCCIHVAQDESHQKIVEESKCLVACLSCQCLQLTISVHFVRFSSAPCPYLRTVYYIYNINIVLH